MLNRRKAMIGWLVWTAAKPLLKRTIKSKASSAVPRPREGASGVNLAALVMAVAAVGGGGYLFWRNRKPNGEEPPES